MALRLLSDYDGWSVAKLETLRNYALSCARLEVLQQSLGEDSRPLHRDLALLKALDLRD